MTTGTATHFASAEPVPATPSRPYDPRYDPLLAPDPGAGRAYAPTWWVASAGTPPEEMGVDEQAAERMHGAYAGVYRALHEARRRLPGWQPRSSLEFGAGLGAGAWAAAEV